MFISKPGGVVSGHRPNSTWTPLDRLTSKLNRKEGDVKLHHSTSNILLLQPPRPSKKLVEVICLFFKINPLHRLLATAITARPKDWCASVAAILVVWNRACIAPLCQSLYKVCPIAETVLGLAQLRSVWWESFWMGEGPDLQYVPQQMQWVCRLVRYPGYMKSPSPLKTNSKKAMLLKLPSIVPA